MLPLFDTSNVVAMQAAPEGKQQSRLCAVLEKTLQVDPTIENYTSKNTRSN